MDAIVSFFNNTDQTLASVIWPAVAGIIIAIIAAYLIKRTVGKFVKKLLTSGADSEANAKSLADLGFEKSFPVKNALRGSTLPKLVSVTEDGRYYIPPDKSFRAETQYAPDGMPFFLVVISVFIIIIVGYLALNYIPELIDLVKQAF